jgi:hypothetical protein
MHMQSVVTVLGQVRRLEREIFPKHESMAADLESEVGVCSGLQCSVVCVVFCSACV